MSTTTLRVLRPVSTVAHQFIEPYTQPALDAGRTVVATGVRAHISSPAGTESYASGEQVTIMYRFTADPADITNLDLVADERTGEEYQVQWVKLRVGLGLDHIEGGLRQTVGVV